MTTRNARASKVTVLRPAKAPFVTLADGATAEVKDGALELRDAEGRLLVRYANGNAEIAAPSGDLTLAAPNGRVVLRSGLDVEVEAARDLVQRAGRRVDVAAGDGERPPQLRIDDAGAELKVDRLSVHAKASRVAIGQVALFARSIATTAERVATRADRYEVEATRIVEKAKDALREVTELAESRIGRVRTLVKDVYSLSTGRTVVTSKEETTIDGKKILLG